jgi:hypothetical protein
MRKNYFVYSHQQLPTIVQWLDIFHRFDGNKHLMLVMFQTISFQKSSWLLPWIYVMIFMDELRFSAHSLKLFFLLVYILDINISYRLSRSGLAVSYGQQV